MKKHITIILIALALTTQAQVRYSTLKQIWNIRSNSTAGLAPTAASFTGKTIVCWNTADSVAYFKEGSSVVAKYAFYAYSSPQKDVYSKVPTGTATYGAPKYLYYVKTSATPGNIPPPTDNTAPNLLFWNTADNIIYRFVANVITPIYRIHGFGIINPEPVIPELPTRIYVSVTGNDASANPHNPNTPYQSIPMVNAIMASLNSGDSILFKSGDVFTGNLIINRNNIYIGRYGIGNKPIISGAKNQSLTTDWTDNGGNIWASSLAVSVWSDMGNVYFNSDSLCGWRRMTVSECVSQGDFYFNKQDKKVYLYSVENPGSFYNNIKVGGVFSEDVIRVYNHDYIVFDGLDVRYSANNGIYFCLADYCIVQNCDISWIGGMLFEGGPTRMGNGIQMWVSNSNLIHRNNYIHDIYDAGISPQGANTYTQSNISIYNNLIVNCWYSYEVFDIATSTLINVNFDNNTCINAGGSWSAPQRPSKTNERHVMWWSSNPGTVTNCNIRNNIFSGCTDNNPCLRFDKSVNPTLNNNLYNVSAVGRINGVAYTALTQWKTASHKDTNSISANPLFASPSDYRLQSSSPAINNGVIIILPVIGELEYKGTAPDQGAFEKE